MTKDQKEVLDGLPLNELESYVIKRRAKLNRGADVAPPPPMRCPYSTIPGEKACDWHEYHGCRWLNGPPSSQ